MRFIADVLKEIIELVRIEAAGVIDSDLELNSYEWLMREMSDPRSTKVQVIPDSRFHPGKIHVFQYDPKYKATLDYYDTHPVMLHLGTIRRGTSILELGINITWYPPVARRFIVSRVRELYQTKYDSAQFVRPHRALDQQRVFLDVYTLRRYLDQLGFSFAIRQYIPQRVVSERAVVSYDNWDRMVELNVPRVFPALRSKEKSLSTIYQEFYKHIQVVNQDRAGRIARIEEQRVTRSLYRFIDR